MLLTTIINSGALMAPLVFFHFVGDWLFQTSEMARLKATNAKVRAIHCTYYTLMFLPLLCLITPHWHWCALIIWSTHFVIDTRVPIYWWVKYVNGDATGKDMDSFIKSYGDHVRFTVNIVYDQMFHIAILYAIAIYITLKGY